MSALRQFEKVQARFMPKRADDLKEGAHQFIGEAAEFKALWIIETGPYEGQWAMEVPRAWDALTDGNFIWIPEIDLEVIQEHHT